MKNIEIFNIKLPNNYYDHGFIMLYEDNNFLSLEGGKLLGPILLLPSRNKGENEIRSIVLEIIECITQNPIKGVSNKYYTFITQNNTNDKKYAYLSHNLLPDQNLYQMIDNSFDIIKTKINELVVFT